METATQRADTIEGTASWTAGKLFRRRVSRYWTWQRRVWKSALDWTVWLYFIIPGFWVGGGLYVESWNEPPDWLTSLPYWFVEGLPFILAVIGRLRTFAEDGDVLFLLQRRVWGERLKLYGMIYTSGILAAMTALLYAVLLPYLHLHYQLSILHIFFLYITTTLWSFIGAIGRSLIQASYRGIRKIAGNIGFGLFLALTYFAALKAADQEPLLLLGAIAMSFASAVWLGFVILKARYTFESDVQAENLMRHFSSEILLKEVIERRPRLRLHRPIVWRKSNRLFKSFDGETVLAEAVLKAFVRRFSMVLLWLRYFSVAAIAIFLIPVWLKPFALLVLLVYFAVWVQSQWRMAIREPVVAQYKWSRNALKRSAARTRFWLVAPGACLLGIASGFQIYGRWGLVMFIPALAVWYAINYTLSVILQANVKQEGD